jgi:hypothetical protein
MALGAVLIGGNAQAETRTWAFDPHGRMWCEFYQPHDDSAFMDFGGEILASLCAPSKLDFFVYLNLRSQAGYHYSGGENAPRTPVDMLHQSWQQALGVSVTRRVPVHFFLLRDCNHQLDKGGFEPVVWTDVVLGVGTLPPFRKSDLDTTGRAAWRWFAGGGPAIRTGQRSAWTINSHVTAEGWLRAWAVQPLWSWGNADGYCEIGLQDAVRRPRLRHYAKTEAGLALHAGKAGWRFFGGQRWRDTRELWPIDQRTYFGLEFIF